MLNFQALEQFNIIYYKTSLFYIPNYLLVIIVILIFALLINNVLNLKNALLATSSILPSILEGFYIFVLDVLKQNVGIKGIIYFPIIYNVFYLVYFVNLSGLVGYNLQLTSHIFVTFSISISLFLGIIIIGLITLKKNFINQFIPKDSPQILFPLLVIIETISYLIRPFTLGIRLFANMFSGHVLLFVIVSFIIVIIEKKIIILKILLLFFPLLLLFLIMCLELLIIFLQAYVFIILLCVYLNDSLYAH